MRSLLRRLLNEPGATMRTLVTRARHDPAWTLVKMDTLVPSVVRRTMYPLLLAVLSWVFSLLGGRAASMGIVFLSASLGRRDAARAHLRARLTASARERAALSRLATQLEETDLAVELATGVPGARGAAARGLALARAGRLHEAVEELSLAGDLPAARIELARAEADLRALDPAWSPGCPSSPGTPSTAGRVLHVVNNALPYITAGYTVRTHEIALAQRRAGLDPVLLTRIGFPWDQGWLDAADHDEVDGLSYHHTGPHVPFAGAAARIEAAVEPYLRMVEQLRPAVLHTTTPYDNGRAVLAVGRATGVPVVYEVRGFLEDTWLSRRPERDADQSERYRLTRAMEAHVAASADAVVTLGQAMRDDLVARGVPPERTLVVGNAVDVERFAPSGNGWGVRRGLGIGDAEVVLGYVSSLVAYEGVENLLEATRLLRDRGHPVRALVVGDGAARADLEARAKELGLADLARFTGRVPRDEVVEFYEAIDVFVVPRRDTRVTRMVTPLKPIEAMAMERPVLVSDLPALTEIIDEGVTGASFRADDPVSLADVAEPLVDDRERRRTIGRAARQWVCEERTWDRAGERYRDLYASLVEG